MNHALNKFPICGICTAHLVVSAKAERLGGLKPNATRELRGGTGARAPVHRHLADGSTAHIAIWQQAYCFPIRATPAATPSQKFLILRFALHYIAGWSCPRGRA